MTMVAIPGGQLFTRLDGDRAKPPLVLSNSLAADHNMWEPQMPFLTRHFQVLRYDTRGHGTSTAPAGPYSFDDLVGDVIAVLDHHGIASATYIGLSLGGMTGLGLALEHPERVSALICCAARADNPPPFVASWDERIAIVERAGTAGLVAGTIERWLTPAFRASHPGETAALEAQIRATSLEGYKGCAVALKTLDYLRHLGRLTVPTFYIAGAEDGAAPVGAMQAMADATPGGTLEVVADAGHIANLNNPAGFDAALLRLLGLG